MLNLNSCPIVKALLVMKQELKKSFRAAVWLCYISWQQGLWSDTVYGRFGRLGNHHSCILATNKSCRIVGASIEMEYVLWKSFTAAVLMKLCLLAAVPAYDTLDALKRAS